MSKSKIIGKRILQEFCESTSLHGYNYLYMTSSIILKLFWTSIILAMTGIAIHFLVKNTNEYMKSNIVTSIESATANLTVRLKNIHTNIF